MKLIDRFVSRELIVNVLFAIAVLSLVLVVGNIFRRLLPLLVNHDVPMVAVLTYLHDSLGIVDRDPARVRAAFRGQ
jgi:lipopolysaccharide export LptBFGC system permease protein LptF